MKNEAINAPCNWLSGESWAVCAVWSTELQRAGGLLRNWGVSLCCRSGGEGRCLQLQSSRSVVGGLWGNPAVGDYTSPALDSAHHVSCWLYLLQCGLLGGSMDCKEGVRGSLLRIGAISWRDLPLPLRVLDSQFEKWLKSCLKKLI